MSRACPQSLIWPLIWLVVLLGLAGVAAKVQAQEAVAQSPASDSAVEVMSSPEASPAEVSEQASLNDAINAQTTAYRAELEKYRTVERNYTVAKGQFKQLSTLASLETAITATQDALAARDRVLLEYFKLLDLQLQNAQGIDVTDKATALTQVAAQRQQVADHLARVEKLSTRVEINALANEFSAMAPDLEGTTYSSLGLLASGRLQVVHDKARVFAAQSEDRVTNVDQTVDTISQQRAVAELNRVLEETQGQLQTVTHDITNARAKASRASYATALKKLAPVYTGLSQVLNYLNELNVSTGLTQ